MRNAAKAEMHGRAGPSVRLDLRGARWSRRRPWLLCAFAAVFAASPWGGELVAWADVAVCREGISRETAERLFAVLNRPEAQTECRFDGVETNQARLEARWSRGSVPVPPVTVVPRECAPDAARHTGRFVVDVPAELAQSCPSAVPLIAEFLKQVGEETPAGEIGSVDDPLFRAARVLFVAVLLVAAGLLVRGAIRLRFLDARWVVLGIAGFSGALVLRAAMPFSLGNWYSEVLPAGGPPPWMRFGPGFFAFQSLIRDAGLWGPQALVLSQLLLGATAIPLLLGVLWEVRIGLEATAATLVLLVLAPFHVRLSASASEHVLASTLCLGLLLSWLCAARTGDYMWLASAGGIL